VTPDFWQPERKRMNGWIKIATRVVIAGLILWILWLMFCFH
jgi:hypothetical protein